MGHAKATLGQMQSWAFPPATRSHTAISFLLGRLHRVGPRLSGGGADPSRSPMVGGRWRRRVVHVAEGGATAGHLPGRCCGSFFAQRHSRPIPPAHSFRDATRAAPAEAVAWEIFAFFIDAAHHRRSRLTTAAITARPAPHPTQTGANWWSRKKKGAWLKPRHPSRA